ncbi:MAG: deoxyribodipyrimidine photo-lyase [Chloroflexi bacterium HGW-Chloroflexi-2]|jgi:deoxyribodipyrimidine photo-lyase|nr:MAG: deoxyribodipyrimidine photo-lyase [Chloroflexi bacterium HGW-Chloroflexi-2]
MKSVIWWIRRDVRLEDNPALQTALQTGLPIIPLFILDPKLLQEPPTRRQIFLFQALQNLDEGLHQLGNRLLVRRGNPLQVLQRIMQEIPVDAIFAEEDYSPYAITRDSQIQNALPLKLILGLVIHHPQQVLKADETPYTIFTPFSKTWKALPKNFTTYPAPKHLPPPEYPLPGVSLSDTDALPYFPASASEAHHRLDSFFQEPIYVYSQGRNLLAQPGTSTLSPYLRFGLLSVRTAYQAALKALINTMRADETIGVETWINELIWREFYISILYHFPNVLQEAFYPHRRNIHWRYVPQEWEAWKQGLTGYPVVDACMRQLNETGWMHNRGRMIVASFLTKDLLHNWQLGERYFRKQLVDGDPAANNGGWQWTAGVGTDAVPYFRIFNPILQSQKFDPQGNFIRQWIPELSKVSQQYIHEPWTMPQDVQQQCGCVIGKHYPAPIVDRTIVKERVLHAFKP